MPNLKPRLNSYSLDTILVSKSNGCTLRRAALDYLARREYSFFELKQKLQMKFPIFEGNAIHDVVCALRTENLQSDERFVESYSRSRKCRGFGYKHIQHSLCRKKIKQCEIDKQLAPDDPEWIEIAVNVIGKKRSGCESDHIDMFERSKITRFMEGRGFMPYQIKKAIDLSNRVD